MDTSWRVGSISSALPIAQILWELCEVPGLKGLQAGHGIHSMTSGNLPLRTRQHMQVEKAMLVCHGASRPLTVLSSGRGFMCSVAITNKAS